MKATKSLLVATLVLPFLVAACNRDEEPYSTSSAPGQQNSQAAAPTTPDKTMESAPPAAGIPPTTTPSTTPSATPSTPAPDAGAPATQPTPPSGNTPAASQPEAPKNP